MNCKDSFKIIVFSMMGLFSINAIAREGKIQCEPGKTVSFNINTENNEAVVNGKKHSCKRIPVSFSTIRNINGQQVAVTYVCDDVEVLTEGWMSSNTRFYARYNEVIYTCDSEKI